MAYDFTGTDRSPPQIETKPMDGKDLEAIVTLMELAALYLSDKSVWFTAEELFAEAQRVGGDEIDLDFQDFSIVLRSAGFLVRQGRRNEYRLK